MQERRHKNLPAGSVTGGEACEGASAGSGRSGTIGLLSISYEAWVCRRGYLVEVYSGRLSFPMANGAGRLVKISRPWLRLWPRGEGDGEISFFFTFTSIIILYIKS